jgi:hypothetical protein
VASAQSSKIDLFLFDMQGRLVGRQQAALSAGYNSLPINTSGLAKGGYSIRGIVAGEGFRVIRFVKQ